MFGRITLSYSILARKKWICFDSNCPFYCSDFLYINMFKFDLYSLFVSMCFLPSLLDQFYISFLECYNQCLCVCMMGFLYCVCVWFGRLLIWEECYYEPVYAGLPQISGIENPELALDEWEACWVSAEARTSRLGVQAGNNVHSLVNKMMMDNHVNIVGEGYDSLDFCCIISLL